MRTLRSSCQDLRGIVQWCDRLLKLGYSCVETGQNGYKRWNHSLYLQETTYRSYAVIFALSCVGSALTDGVSCYGSSYQADDSHQLDLSCLVIHGWLYVKAG